MEDSLAHTKWDCTYHIVWIPKYRKKILYGETRKELIEIIKSLLERRRLELVAGLMCVDHVHISIRIPPKESVSDVVGYLKGKSALMLFDRHPEYRKRFWRDKTLWARGYYVSTVGLNEELVKAYIEQQENAEKIRE